jgi:serine/threonine protein kinase
MQGTTALDVRLVDGFKTLHINGHPLNSHEILDILGSGANGTVYLAINRTLDRKEAIKVWLKNRAHDNRDKLEQGLAEARKLAAANKESSVEIYSAQVFHAVPVAIMEYIDGKTLREYKKGGSNKHQLLGLAYLYLEAIEKTTTKSLMHGDPHLSNVLVYRYSPDLYTDELRMKLCDFGTSIFSGKEHSEDRHWRIVEESVIELTKNIEGFDYAKSQLPIFKKNLATIDLTKDLDLFTGKQIAQIRNSPLRDYLDCFKSTS